MWTSAQCFVSSHFALSLSALYLYLFSTVSNDFSGPSFVLQWIAKSIPSGNRLLLAVRSSVDFSHTNTLTTDTDEDSTTSRRDRGKYKAMEKQPSVTPRKREKERDNKEGKNRDVDAVTAGVSVRYLCRGRSRKWPRQKNERKDHDNVAVDAPDESAPVALRFSESVKTAILKTRKISKILGQKKGRCR